MYTFDDIIDTVAKVGGLDIAGMIGLILGCSYMQIPCVLDGVISNISAVCAVKMCSKVRDYIIVSHKSSEPSSKVLLDFLEKKAVIDASLRLGEGSGAVAVVPLIDMAFEIYNNTITFEESNFEQYEKLV